MWIDGTDQPWLGQGEPESSYEEAVVDPGTDPRAAPLLCVSFNQAWQPYACGALTQLVNPATWTETDPTALADLQARATDLIALVAAATLCSALQLQIDAAGALQYSVDGGATWVTLIVFAAPVGSVEALPAAPAPIPLGNGAPSPWLLNAPGGQFITAT